MTAAANDNTDHKPTDLRFHWSCNAVRFVVPGTTYSGPPTPADGPRPIDCHGLIAIAYRMTERDAIAALLAATANATRQ